VVLRDSLGDANFSCSGFGSGGGISPDGIPIPAYQQVSGVVTSSNGGSITYRNAPDVAAEANCDNYAFAGGFAQTGLGGTSLATPTWAGYAALLNEQAAVNGQPPLGFASPLLYAEGTGGSAASFFHDISSGDNGGFSAVAGYDLVTGWGSPVVIPSSYTGSTTLTALTQSAINVPVGVNLALVATGTAEPAPDRMGWLITFKSKVDRQTVSRWRPWSITRASTCLEPARPPKLMAANWQPIRYKLVLKLPDLGRTFDGIDQFYQHVR
jgi:hypothetical protein